MKQKENSFKKEIEEIRNLKDLKAFYYIKVQHFQDHHYLWILKRIIKLEYEEIQSSSKQLHLTLKQKESFRNFQEKIENKILEKVQFFDAEDVMLLLKLLCKLIDNKAFRKDYVKQVLSILGKNQFNYELQEKYRIEKLQKNIQKNYIISNPLNFSLLDYTHNQLLQLCQIFNKVFNSIIILNTNEQIAESNANIGESLAQLFKLIFMIVSTTKQTLSFSDLVTIINQLSKFNLQSKSVFKEIFNKVKKHLNELNLKSSQTLFYSLIRMNLHEQELEQLFLDIILKNFKDLKYQEVVHFLEMVLQASSISEDIKSQIVQQTILYLEQKQLNFFQNKQELATAEEKENQRDGDKLTIQEGIKIFKYLIQLGHLEWLDSKEENSNRSSGIVLNLMINLISKNLDKMPTNQLAETLYILRSILKNSEFSENIKIKYVTVISKVEQLIIEKLPLFNQPKLFLMIIQDSAFKDNYKLFLKTKNNLEKAFDSIIENKGLLFDSVNELNMTNNLFKDVDDSLYCSKLLKQMMKKQSVVLVRAKTKKQFSLQELVLQWYQQLYLLILRELRSNDEKEEEFSGGRFNNIQIIQNKEYWKDVQEQINQFQQNGIFNKIKFNQSGEVEENVSSNMQHLKMFYEIYKFEQLILKRKVKIVPDLLKEEILAYKQNLNNYEKNAQKLIRMTDAIDKELNIKLERNYKFDLKDLNLSLLSSNQQENQQDRLKEENNSIIIQTDLYNKDKKLAYNLISQQILRDTRFLTEKTFMDKHQLQLLGNKETTYYNYVQGHQHRSQLSQVDAYLLKYYEGVNLLLLDHKRLKDKVYLSYIFNQ